MATISDIAKQANVSRTLVSRVLNNKPGVSPENRKKILEIIEENHYVPNGLAKSLVLQKTGTIGVVMDDLCNDFFFQLIHGLQDAAEAQTASSPMGAVSMTKNFSVMWRRNRQTVS